MFHRKLRSRWLPNTNEIDTKKHEVYMANTRGPNATYIPPAHIGSIGIFIGSAKLFRSDTNMLVSATRKSHVGGITKCEGVCVAVEYRLNFSYFFILNVHQVASDHTNTE